MTECGFCGNILQKVRESNDPNTSILRFHCNHCNFDIIPSDLWSGLQCFITDVYKPRLAALEQTVSELKLALATQAMVLAEIKKTLKEVIVNYGE
jgi:hypothetical protein